MTEDIKKESAGDGRDEQGRWLPGVSGNPKGAEPWTEEQKAKKKALKESIAEYKQRLSEALPKLDTVLVEKALGGDIQAHKEINEVLGMHKQIHTGGDEEDNAIQINISEKIANKNELYDITRSSEQGS